MPENDLKQTCKNPGVHAGVRVNWPVLFQTTNRKTHKSDTYRISKSRRCQMRLRDFFVMLKEPCYLKPLKGILMKVLLADRKPNIRYGLMVLLGEQPDLEIMGDTDNAGDLLFQIQKGCPDLLLLGWGLPGLPMDELFSEMCHLCPQIYVIVLSERAYLRETTIKTGADAFMCKGDPPEKLLALVQKAQTFKAQDISTKCSSEIRYSSDIEIQ